MDKRYQVFVSSTYADLKEERQQVIQTLMEMDCIPAGMELFPASDEDQFNFIKRIIDDCDYYILVIGGRYGSLTPQGISYTEQEFDYAIEKGLRVVALLHGDPASIPSRNTDNDPELTKRLVAFRNKAQSGRLVKYWQNASELPGLVSLSLSKTIKTYPAVGWVRASNAGSTELLFEINELRKENESLRSRLQVFSEDPLGEDLNPAGLDEKITVTGKYSPNYRQKDTWYGWSFNMTWGKIFSLIGPTIMTITIDKSVENILCKAILKNYGEEFYQARFAPQLFNTIKLQFRALGLVDIKQYPVDGGGVDLFWQLTKKGEAELMRRRVIQSGSASEA